MTDSQGKAVPAFDVWIHPDYDKGGCVHVAGGTAVVLPEVADRVVVVVVGKLAEAFDLKGLGWGERRKIAVVLDR